MKRSNTPWYKRYHWHWLVLHLVLIMPLAALHTVGEWAYTAGEWLLRHLPSVRKEK